MKTMRWFDTSIIFYDLKVKINGTLPLPEPMLSYGQQDPSPCGKHFTTNLFIVHTFLVYQHMEMFEKCQIVPDIMC